MSRLFVHIILAMGFGLSFQAMGADVYKTVDEDGNVQYSDEIQSDNSEAIELPAINVQPAVIPRVRVSPIPAAGPGPIEAWISSPANEHVVTPGEQSFSVSGGLSRDLLENEYAQLLVNGEVYGGDSKTLSWVISSLVRGEYQLQLQVVTDDALTAASDSRVVYVQRAFVRGL